MNRMPKLTRAQRREEKLKKEIYGPKGGGFAAQAKRTQVNRGYVGLPKALKPKIRKKEESF